MVPSRGAVAPPVWFCAAGRRAGLLLVCALIGACAAFEDPPPPRPRIPLATETVPTGVPPLPPPSQVVRSVPAQQAVQAQQPVSRPAPVQAPVQTYRPQQGVDRGGYRLGVGDSIRISVHGEPDLTMDVRIGESGFVNYPFLGDIRVLGMTVSQLEQTIDRGLRGDYLIAPDVRVLVTAYRYFYVNGEVRLPGGYPFQPGLTVRQAVTLAGGLTERASSRRITVYRESQPSVPIDATLDTMVNPGDIVAVDQGLF